MEKITVFLIFAIISFVFATCSALYIWFWRREYNQRVKANKNKEQSTKNENSKANAKTKEEKNFLASNLQLFTGAIFVAVVILFLPVFYYNYELFGEYSCLRPILISIHTAIRTFILDGDFNTVSDAVNTLTPEWQRVAFSSYAAVLYVLAPLLTLTNIVYIFKNMFLELRIKKLYKNRPMYVMSELNVCSVTLAESIVECNSKEKPVIVFTDVFEQNEEDDYELLLRTRNINALCLKKDVSHLDLSKRKGKTEIFLIGEAESGDNEAENVEHAIKLTQKYNDKKNISIYVFASSPGAGYIMDSLDKGKNTLDDKFEDYIIRDPLDILYGNEWKNDNIRVDGGFYIRRINCVEALVKNTLDNKEAYDAVIKSADKNDKTISIMIIGMGKYGKQFFKNAIWFYQLNGYRLEINIFDVDRQGTDTVKKQLEQECPELISVNPSNVDGDANYDIRFFSGIDCFSSDFVKCFDSSESGMRLKRTNLAFVTLGEDDKNIEAAVMLRTLFDRKNHYTNKDVTNAELYEMPIINAVVYDEQKASNLSASGSALKNHKEQNYHINFIGDRASQYDYKNIEQNRKFEHSAFKYHIDWLRKTAQLRHFYNTDASFKATVDANRSNVNEPVYWGDEFLYTGADGRTDFGGVVNADKIKDEARKYVNYEYFRRSSMAKAKHKIITADYFENAAGHNDICTCADCEAKRKTEHMRWNAYMRAEGFIYGVRNDRAKTHPDIRPWNELLYLDRFKD